MYNCDVNIFVLTIVAKMYSVDIYIYIYCIWILYSILASPHTEIEHREWINQTT